MLLPPMRMIEWIRLISIGLSLAAGLVILPWRRFYQNPFLAIWLVAHALVFGAFFSQAVGDFSWGSDARSVVWVVFGPVTIVWAALWRGKR